MTAQRICCKHCRVRLVLRWDHVGIPDVRFGMAARDTSTVLSYYGGVLALSVELFCLVDWSQDIGVAYNTCNEHETESSSKT